MKNKFLDGFLSNAELDRWLLDLQARFPQDITAEINVIGQSAEKRDILVLHVWPRGRSVRQPTLWVDANMHSAELVGTNVVLAQIQTLAEKLAGPDKSTYASRNYIFVPRICPDGAACYFDNGLTSRSNNRDRRSSTERGSFWVRQCLKLKQAREHSGVALLQNPQRVGAMRRQNPAGVWTCDDEFPALMRRRDFDDKGPFFDIFPEGTIENYDGVNLPKANQVDQNEVDLNRNFPIFWKADRTKTKSGPFPLSEPESKAVVDYSSRFPEIYFWLNYHTFGGVFIRPPEHEPDSKLPRLDFSVFELLDREIERITHYPAVAGFAEFLYEPGVPLPGTLTDWAYYGLGAYAYVCELWDLPIRLAHRDRPFIKRYTIWKSEDWRVLYRFDRDFNNQLLFGHPWLSYEHEQLGAVEISELPTVFGIQNPPAKLIKEVVKPQISLFETLVKLAPQPHCRATLVPRIGKSAALISEVNLEIMNTGFLPTYVSDQKNDVNGPQNIVVKILENTNVEILGPKTHMVPDLGGYVPINTGWLDFAADGSNARTSQTLRIAVQKTDPLTSSKIVLEVHFPRAGVHATTLEF